MNGHFNHIHILGYLSYTRVMYHYQKSQECFQNRFLEFHSTASSLVNIALSFRSFIWLHCWNFYHNYVTRRYPEMISDWCSEKKIDFIKEKFLNVLISRSSEDWKQFLNFMMCTHHTCNLDNWNKWNKCWSNQMFLQCACTRNMCSCLSKHVVIGSCLNKWSSYALCEHMNI